MALTHLVDTSVLKRLRNSTVREVVEPLALAGSAARATISDLEVGYSARSTREWDSLASDLDVFARVEISSEHVNRSLQVQRLLAARHQRGGRFRTS